MVVTSEKGKGTHLTTPYSNEDLSASRQAGVSDLPIIVTQLRPNPGIEPATSWSPSPNTYCWATTPPFSGNYRCLDVIYLGDMWHRLLPPRQNKIKIVTICSGLSKVNSESTMAMQIKKQCLGVIAEINEFSVFDGMLWAMWWTVPGRPGSAVAN